MTGPLHSAHWFRVAELRPQLHSHVVSQRQVQRGQVWHVLTSSDGARSFRFNATAWALVARCDGQRSLDQLWGIVLAACGDEAPTQDECLSILTRLHHAGLLSFDRRPDFGHGGRSPAPEPDPGNPHRNSLLAWRIPLGRPQRSLDRLARHWPRGWGLPAGIFAIVALLWTAGTVATHAQDMALQLHRMLGSHLAWILALVAYPLLKLAHECAHGLAARRFGVPVREWGLAFLMFMPVPYVDVSAASALPRRRQRMGVAAAGIFFEGAVAVAALALWLQLQPGPWRDAALLVVVMAGFSSWVVNANPLLRFDGYHLLCDALNLPNLATRSARFWQHHLARWVLGRVSPHAMVPAKGESLWLWVYAPAAWVMRWTIACAVVLWVGHVSAVLGGLAAGALAFSLVGVPVVKAFRFWRSGAIRSWQRVASDESSSGLWRRRMTWASPVAGLLAVTFWPLPVATVAEGVVGLPESALVRSQVAGQVEQVLVSDGQTVQAGEPVMQLSSTSLQADLDRLRGHVEALRAEQSQALQQDPAQAIQLEHRLHAASAELAQAEQRQAQLTVRAAAAGRVVIDRAGDWAGRHVQRGDLLAHVITGEPGRIHVAVPHDRAAHVGRLLPAVGTPGGEGASVLTGPSFAVRSVDASVPERWARWVGLPSGGVTQLPSAALGDRSGGRIATDPADASGLRPAQPVLVGELALEAGSTTRLGERVLVRFEHGRSPLLMQLAEQVQKQVLHHFNPNT